MTDQSRIQSAIDHIKSAVDVDDWAKGIAIDALKKEVPEKPMKSIDPYNVDLYKLCCPTCGKYIGYGDRRVGTINRFTMSPDRCGYCGQKILWGG